MSRQASDIHPLTASEWRIAAQAALLLPIATMVIRCLGVKDAIALFRSRPSSPSDISLESVSRIVHAVTSRLGARCLAGAVVLHILLARNGVASEVVLGATKEAGRFRGHAWVEHDGVVISIDGPDGCVPFLRLASPGSSVLL